MKKHSPQPAHPFWTWAWDSSPGAFTSSLRKSGPVPVPTGASVTPSPASESGGDITCLWSDFQESHVIAEKL